MRRPVGLVILVAAVLLPAALGLRGALASNDPYYGRQWGPQDVGAPAAWARTKGGGVTIAVVDSGVDLHHPDLVGNLVPGYDFADNDDNPDDDSQQKDGQGKVVQGHGTHVAGIAAAVADNNIGIAGVAPAAKIMPLKVFPTNPNAPLVNVLTAVPAAIRYAVDHGAKVINLSLGDALPRNALVGIIETPCADAYNRGALCVVAAGNSGDNPSGYSRNVEFLCVTAHDRKDEHASFGQHADTQWALSAPGVDIYSTYPTSKGSYATEQGTSMAAPHAAGVAALLFALGLSNGQVVDRMLSTATPMGNPGVNGAGRVNAAAAAGVVAAPPTTVAAARQTTATTRRAQATGSGGTDQALFGTPTTQGTLPPAAAATASDDLAFSAGPSDNGKLVALGPRKRAKSVSGGTIALTLGALGVFGLGWGGVSRLRSRGSAAEELPTGDG